MRWTSALAIYFLFWFLCLFLVLPFHGRTTDNATDTAVAGQDGGAPHHFPALRIALQVSLVSALAFALYYLGYSSDFFSRAMFDFFPKAPPRS